MAAIVNSETDKLLESEDIGESSQTEDRIRNSQSPDTTQSADTHDDQSAHTLHDQSADNPQSATNSQLANNPRRSLVMVIWLTLQLVVSAVMTTLSTFHLFAPGSTLPCTANASDGNGTITSCPTWELSIVSMFFTALFLIVSVGDATINMHNLVHQVPDKKTDGKSDPCQNHEENNFKFCCSKFPMDAIRVWYCWILLTIILTTVAANTYEWSWQTDDLKVLSNSALFFFTCITYILLLIIGMLVWHCNFFDPCMKKENCKSCCCVSIPSIVLIITNTIFIVVAMCILLVIYIVNVSAIIITIIVTLICVFVSTSTCLVVVLACYKKNQPSDNQRQPSDNQRQPSENQRQPSDNQSDSREHSVVV